MKFCIKILQSPGTSYTFNKCSRFSYNPNKGNSNRFKLNLKFNNALVTCLGRNEASKRGK